MIEIIRITPNDRAIINDLLINLINSHQENEAQATHQTLSELLNNERNYLYAAVLDEKCFGYALAYRFPSLYSAKNLAYLYDIEVLENHWKKGIGKQLIDAIKPGLKADNVEELWLGTATDNIGGQHLFSSTGAEKSTEVFDEYIYYLG